MSINDIIESWNSKDIINTKPYLIIDELIKHFNKISDNELINLHLIDKKFDNFSWYICKKRGQIFNVNLYIDEESFMSNRENKTILDILKANSYIKLNFYLKTLKRSQFFDKSKLSTMITINININEIPEYFKLDNIKKIEIPINIIIKNKKRRLSEVCESNKREEIEIIKKKKEDIDWSEWVSASRVRNVFLDDTIIDWLVEFNITSLDDKPVNKKCNSRGTIKYEVEDTFTNFIKAQGIEFEEKIIDIINKKHSVIKIAESYQAKDSELFKKTIDFMKEGKPIIYQGVLHNHNNKTFGAPDLMIRNDYINKFIGYDLYDNNIGSPKLGTPWHYVIVDIKHSTITLTSDGIHIRNDGSVKAYKGQLLVYTEALNVVQGTNLSKAFILGKKYSYESKGKQYEINELLTKMGVIDYSTCDKWCNDKLKKALDWIRLVRKEGHNWKLLPMPSKDELFPNMKNDKDGAFNKIKKSLAEEISEITSVTYCGVDKRKLAFSQGVYGWNDDKCTSELLGFKDSPLASRIDAILDINRQSEVYVKPEKVKYDGNQWRKRKDNEMEFFLDYETINSNFGKISGDVYFEGCEFIFMLGAGFINKNKTWEFKSFIMEYKTKESERKMLDSFWDFINKKLKEYKKTESIFIHWSQAEKIAYEKSQLRHLNLQDKKLIDLYEVFIKEPIVVKGALNYSLKTIMKSLYKHNLVKTTWNTSNPCSNGLNAMLLAHKCYEKNEKVTNNILTIKNIEEYNEIDCKSLWEIIEYLRKNH
jgi:hypothetical protein